MNPERRSSGSQFYIVWGQTYNDGQLKQLGKQLEMQALQQTFNALVAAHRSEIMEMRRNRNREGLQALQDELEAQARKTVKEEAAPALSPEQMEAYKTVAVHHTSTDNTPCLAKWKADSKWLSKFSRCPPVSADRPATDVVVTSIECLD